MSDLGPMQNDNNVFYNDEKVNEEIKKIIDKCMIQANTIIKENKTLLEQIAQLLLEKEIIRETDLNNIMANLNSSARKISINQIQK
ncbi:MAG: ATP-dependent zinc metalloprotease FtsH [Candidatus Phytoplasma pruni]